MTESAPFCQPDKVQEYPQRLFVLFGDEVIRPAVGRALINPDDTHQAIPQ
jgi:hypothetical protein